MQLQEPDPDDDTSRPYIMVINEALLNRAKKGDIAAIREVYNRIDGKPTPSLDLAQATAIVQRASREDKERLAMYLNLPIQVLEERMAAYADPVVSDPDMPEDLDKALAIIERAAAKNPGLVRRYITPVINQFDKDNDE